MDLQPGDVFATKGRGTTGWAVRRLLSPTMDRYHFGIIWKCLKGDDFLILESISKGLAVGKLSWYQSTDVEFYRVECPQELRIAAPGSLVDWGRAKYDYWLIGRILSGAAVALVRILLKEHRLRRLRAEDFPYGKNSALICTEAVDVAYDAVGVNLIPEGILPLPNAFRQAELDGRMRKVTE